MLVRCVIQKLWQKTCLLHLFGYLECVPKNEYYVTVVFVVVFHIPIIMMIFLYARIFRIAQRHAVQISTLQKSTDSQYSKGIMPNAIQSLTARKHLRRTDTQNSF